MNSAGSSMMINLSVHLLEQTGGPCRTAASWSFMRSLAADGACPRCRVRPCAPPRRTDQEGHVLVNRFFGADGSAVVCGCFSLPQTAHAARRLQEASWQAGLSATRSQETSRRAASGPGACRGPETGARFAPVVPPRWHCAGWSPSRVHVVRRPWSSVSPRS